MLNIIQNSVSLEKYRGNEEKDHYITNVYYKNTDRLIGTHSTNIPHCVTNAPSTQIASVPKHNTTHTQDSDGSSCAIEREVTNDELYILTVQYATLPEDPRRVGKCHDGEAKPPSLLPKMAKSKERQTLQT